MTAAVNLATVGSNATATGTLIVSCTAVASTSGTSIDFNSIPSWAKRITVMFNGVSLSGTSPYLFQLGDSGGIENSGYVGASIVLASTGNLYTNYTNGVYMYNDTPSVTYTGRLEVLLLNTNTYTIILQASSTDARTYAATSSKTLSAVLDRVRVTTVNGTDTFDAGTINILWE